ncbi:DUF6950 family protein [Sphingomonas sp.]|uniref:DUF6950 family protein n=1 Tax=Sphingomonas sp. TaxID=28214 RepID=UPI002FDAAD91
MDLADFLHDAPRDPSPWNCSTFPADWCVALGLPDFAAPWRHIIEMEACEQEASVGLLRLWEHGIGDALPVADAPYQPGDIAVVARAGLEAGAIFDGAMWALRTPRGIVFVTLPASAIAKAWRPHRG